MMSVEVGERYAEGRAYEAAAEDVAGEYGTTAEAVRNAVANVEAGKGTAGEQEIYKRLGEAMEAKRGEMSAEAIRTRIESEEGCSVDAILGKSPDKRTQAEQAVVERYLEELYPEGMSNVESGKSNAGRGSSDGRNSSDSSDSSIGEGPAQDVELVPIGHGVFGDVYDQFRGNAQGAIAFLEAKQGGEAVGALHHKDVGDISLVWGNDKAGLKKILQKHPEVVDNLQGVIDGMQVVQSSDNRIVLESDTHKAVVSKMLGQEKTPQWLLTAYEKKNASGGSSDIDPEPQEGMQNGTAPLQSDSSGGKGTTNVSDVQGRAERDAARAQAKAEAEAALEEAFAGREEMLADAKDDPWETLRDPELTSEQRDAVVQYLNNVESGKSNEESAQAAQTMQPMGMTAEVAQATARRINHESGMVVPARTVPMGDAPAEDVYIVSGEVRMQPDGSGIDRGNSDSFIVVCDGDGNYHATSPERLESVGEAMTPEQLAQTLENNGSDGSNGRNGSNGSDRSIGEAPAGYDVQGNPVDVQGRLVVENVGSMDEITDGDFETPTRNVQLPDLPENVSTAIGSGGKPVVIKKSVFEKNRDNHPEIDAAESRSILERALYNPDLVGSVQARRRPYYRVAIQTGDRNAVVVLDIYDGKDNTEIVGWREINERGLERMRRQAAKDDGQLIILSPSDKPGSAAALSTLQDGLSSGGKGSEKAADAQGVQAAGALSRVPVDAKGEPMFEAAEDASTAWDALVEYSGGDAATAREIVSVMVEQKRKGYERAQKLKPKGKTPAEILSSKRDIDAERARTQQEYDRWRQMSEVERERAAAAEREREAEARRLAAEQAERERAARAAQAEADRRRLERLNGVPDWRADTADAARARGYRRSGPEVIERQGAVDAVRGKAVRVKFAKDTTEDGVAAVIDVEALQPSHVQGVRNVRHFIPEAQPKDRKDAVSKVSAQDIARDIRPEEITGSITAYTGAPSVNARGETIQGNSRADALKWMYDSEPEQAAKYKAYLVEHAEDFGMDAEDIEAMERPVLVNMLDVDDARAIRLGQYVQSDTESGGVERIRGRAAARKMGADIRQYAERLLSSEDEEASISQLIASNGVKTLQWMNTHGYITDTQYASCFDRKGELTGAAAEDLKDVLYQGIFEGGSVEIEEMFAKLPAKAQRAILATAYRDYDSAEADSIRGEIQQAIVLYNEIMMYPQYAGATNIESALTAVVAWSQQYAFDEASGESYLPAERFSNFALHLAAMYKGMSQRGLQKMFNDLYDTIQGVGEDTLFESVEHTPHTIAEAVYKVLGIEYKPVNGINNGEKGHVPVADDGEVGQGGRRGSTTDVGGRERVAGSGRTDERRRGTAAAGSGAGGVGLSEGGGPVGRSLSESEATDLVGRMEASAEVAPTVELTPENWLAQFGEDGMVDTPIGVVKMGENQFIKMYSRGRAEYFGMVYPTLNEPDVVLEEVDPKDGSERDSKYLFVKTFVKADGTRIVHFESVTVKKDGMEVSISSHEIKDTAVKNKMQNDKILHLAEKLSPGSEWRLTETSSGSERPDLVPTSDKTSLRGKGTTKSADAQGENAESSRNGLNSSNGKKEDNAAQIVRLEELLEKPGADKKLVRAEIARLRGEAAGGKEPKKPEKERKETVFQQAERVAKGARDKREGAKKVGYNAETKKWKGIPSGDIVATSAADRFGIITGYTHDPRIIAVHNSKSGRTWLEVEVDDDHAETPERIVEVLEKEGYEMEGRGGIATVNFDSYNEAKAFSEHVREIQKRVDAERQLNVESAQGQAQNKPDNEGGVIGRSLTEREATEFVGRMEAQAEAAPEVELTPENWKVQFGEDGKVDTPMGVVKMGENQYAKMQQRGRAEYFGMVYPTLNAPDVIMEKTAPTEGAERDTKYIFVKTFVKPDGSRLVHFESITVRRDGMEVSVSSHEAAAKDIKKDMQNEKILHISEKLSPDSEWSLTEAPNGSERPDLVPTSDKTSGDKVTTKEAEKQEQGEEGAAADVDAELAAKLRKSPGLELSTKKVKGKVTVNPKDYAPWRKTKEDNERPFLRGVHYEGGLAIATDSYSIIMVRSKYPAAWEGKTIGWDGNALDMGDYSYVPWHTLLRFLSMHKKALYAVDKAAFRSAVEEARADKARGERNVLDYAIGVPYAGGEVYIALERAELLVDLMGKVKNGELRLNNTGPYVCLSGDGVYSIHMGLSKERMNQGSGTYVVDMPQAAISAVRAMDSQGNPVNADGTLKLERVSSVDEITDADFAEPKRNVQLPELPYSVDLAIGANGKPVIIKKNIFEKNRKNHGDLTAEQSREILREALYRPDMYGQNQKTSRPYNWILIHNAEKHSSVILEVSHSKDNVEIVNWHYLDDTALRQKERQAVREGGLILTLASAAGDTQDGLSSGGKGSNKSAGTQMKQNKADGAVAEGVEASEAVLRDAVVERLRESGLEVITDVEAGQKVLDEANGGQAQLRMHAQLTALTKASNTIKAWLDGNKRGKVFTIELPEATQRMVRRAMGRDFDSHNITANGVVHAQKNHGVEGRKLKERSIPLTKADMELMPYVMTAPDYVRRGSDDVSGRVSVRFYKELSNGYVVVAEKEYKNSPNDMETITMWAELSDKATNARREAAPDTHVQNAILDIDAAKIRRDAENAIENDIKIREHRVYHGSGADYTHGGRADGAKNYVIFDDKDLKITDHVRFFRTAGGEAYGFTVGGKIYIDPRIAMAETPIHEYAHLWAEALRCGNAAEWSNVVGLMKDTPVWAEVRERYPELESDDEIADEVIATYSGRRGAERLRQEAKKVAEGKGGVFEKAEAISALARVKAALARFWKGVCDFLHIRYTRAEEVADRVMKDLLDGVNPRDVLRKNKQNEVIQRSNPMGDDYHTGVRGVEDIRTMREAISEARAEGAEGGWETLSSYPDVSNAMLEEALRSGRVRVYSSKPIEAGVFVTPSRMQAEDYAGGGRVYSKEVSVDDVAWLNTDEGQLAPEAMSEAGSRMTDGVRMEAARRRSEEAERRDKQLRAQDIATAIVTGKTEAQARAERRERERKYKEETKELYARVLSGDFNEVTLRLINDYLDKVTPLNYYGRPLSKRLPARALRKMPIGERTGSIDALFSRISESAVGAHERAGAEGKRRIEEKKKELLKGWAIATGHWHTDVSDFTDDKKPIGSGKDSDVYHSRDGESVIKVSKGKEDIKRHRPDIDNIALFNYVFPGSKYEIIGYGEIGGKFVRFLRQPIVDFTDSKPLTVEDRVEYMERLGFRPMNAEKTAFTNGEIVASDIQGNNIVKDSLGNVRVIDADMRLHTKDVGGEYTYAPVEKDTEIMSNGESRMSDGPRFQFIGERGAEDMAAVNARFNEELERYKAGEMDKNEVLHLGKPQGVMRAFLPDLPIVMRQRILNKGSVRKHNVAIEALADMPNHMSHPIFVFKRSDNALGVLTEMQDRDGKNICVAIELNRQIQNGGEILEVNDVRSIHGRNVADIVYPIVENGTLKWVDKEKGLAYLSSASRYVQQEIDRQNLEIAAKVVKEFENPKVSEEKGADGVSAGSLETEDESDAGSNSRNSFDSSNSSAGAKGDDRDPRAMAMRARELGERLHTSVRVIRTEEEVAALPSARQRGMKGGYNTRTGEVTVVVPNNANVADVENTVLHEVVGHDGLRVLFPEEEKLNNALDELYRVSDDGIKADIDSRAQKMSEGETSAKTREQYRREATEEYAADLAGRIGEGGFERMSAAEKTFWGRLTAMLQKALQRLLDGLKIRGKRKWSDKEWAFVLHEAFKRKKNGGNPTVFDAADTEVMRRKTGYGEENKGRDGGGNQKETVNLQYGKRLGQDNSNKHNSEKRWDDSQSMAGDASGRLASVGDRGSVRVFEEGLATNRRQHLDDSERDRREAESERLVDIAKENGLYISKERIRDLGQRKHKQSRESEVYINNDAGKVYKVKDPYASAAMKPGVKPEDAIYEYHVHNKYFPETTYTFEGITDDLGDVRIVLSQDLVRSTKRASARQVEEYLAQKGLKRMDGYHFGNDEVTVTDVEGDNAFIDENGKVRIIDPVIDFKKPVEEILGDESRDGGIKFRDGDDIVRSDKALARALYEPIIRTSRYQMTEAFQDSMLGLKTLYKAVEKASGSNRDIADIPGYENAYLAENRMSSVVMESQRIYADRYMKPLTDAVAKLAGGMRGKQRVIDYMMAKLAGGMRGKQRVIDYMMAKHGLERNEYMRKQAAENGEETERDFAGLTALTGLDDWQAAEGAARVMVDDFESAESAEQVEALWKAVNAATKKTLKTLYDGGIISRDTYEQVRDMYEYYIPLRGWDETTSDEVYAYLRQRGGSGNVMKKAEGRASKADDPLVAIAGMAESAIMQAEKNKVKQCFLNYALSHPSDLVSVNRLWLQHDEVADEWRPVTPHIDIKDSPEEIDRKNGEFEAHMRALAKAEPDIRRRTLEPSLCLAAEFCEVV